MGRGVVDIRPPPTRAVAPRPADRAGELSRATTACLAVLGTALWTLAVVLTATDARRDWVDRSVVEALIVGVPMAAGLWATRSPRNVRFGLILFGSGVVWSLTALAETSSSLPYSLGRVAAWLIFPTIMYLMLAFPEGRLVGSDRRLYGALILLVAALFIGSALFVEAYPAQTPWASCDTDCPANAFLVLHSEPAIMDGLVQPVRELLAIIVLAGIARSLLLRLRSGPAPRRRLLGPLAVVSLVSIGVLVAYLTARRVAPGAAAVETLGTIWSLSIPAIAIAFLVGLVQRRLVMGEVLSGLSASLVAGLDPGRLRSALAVALSDPTVEVLYPDEVPGLWRDANGHVRSTSAALTEGQAVTLILDGDAPIAALVHDPALRDDEELLEAVGSLVRTALRHQRLTSRLETSLEELEESRERIARASDAERSRIERDLHDGAQQRLIMLRIKLSLAEELLQTDAVAGAEAVHELGSEVELVLDELRSLAHGVYPALLSDRGLEDALRGALSEAPVRGHLDARGVTRQSREIEAAIYFACLEALQNATKHAPGATGVWISLRQGQALRFEVRDDGPGFLPPGPDANGGLRNMRDRLETVGGRLTIDTAPGHGTRVRGVVPLSAGGVHAHSG